MSTQTSRLSWFGRADAIDNPYWTYLIENIPSDKALSRWRKGEDAYTPEAHGLDYEKGKGFTKAERASRADLVAKFAWAIPSPQSLAFVARALEVQGVRDIVEIGAGTGYWAWMLTQLGFDVAAYDLHPPDQDENWFHSEHESFEREYTQEDVDAYMERWGPLRESVDYLTEVTKGSDNPFPSIPAPAPPKVGDPWRGERVVPGARRATFHPVAKGDVDVLDAHPDRALLLCWPPYSNEMAVRALMSYPGDLLIYIGEGEGGCCADDAFFDLLRDQWVEVDSTIHNHIQWSGINDEIAIFRRKEK